MPHIRMLIAALLGVLAVAVDAGIVYRYSIKYSTKSTGGQVWIDGDKKRIELDPDPEQPRPYDVEITAKGTTTYVNLQNRTYYEQKSLSSGTHVWSSLFQMVTPSQHLVGKPQLSYRSEAGPLTLDRETTRHVIQLQYRVGGELDGVPLRGRVDAVITVLTAPSLPGGHATPGEHTGFAELDDELTRLYASFKGMIVRHELSVNSGYEEGRMFHTLTVMSVDQLKETDVKPSLFAIPSGLTYQEPVFGGPGL